MLAIIILPLLLAAFAFLAVTWYYARQLIHPPRQSACQLPSDLGLDAQRVEFPATDGVCLRGWWVPAARPCGTLVFSHGFSGDCSPDLEYAAWLTGEGYNLLYFDHRAHGASGGDLTTLGYLETRDLLGAINFLRQRGIERVGAIGFSMGGAVVLQTAPLTEAIRCVIVDCTFASLPGLITYHAARTRLPRFLAPLGAHLLVAWASLMARANLFAHSPVRSIGALAPRPLLMIQAGHDELVPASETEQLYAAAREPKQLWRVDGALHRAVDKAAPEEYRRRVSEFLERYLASQQDHQRDRRAESGRGDMRQAA